MRRHGSFAHERPRPSLIGLSRWRRDPSSENPCGRPRPWSTVAPDRSEECERVVVGSQVAIPPLIPSPGLAEASFLLVAVGLFCVVFRLASPNRWSVTIGSVLLMFGVVALLALPVHPGGVLLLAFAATLLFVEVLGYPGTGLHAVGGGVSLLLAGLCLTGQGSGAHPAVVVPTAVGTVVASYLAGRRSWRYARNKPLAPFPQLAGRRTVVMSSTGSVGRGVVGGELWQLRAQRGLLVDGQAVQVVEALEEYLIVEPAAHADFS